MHGHKTGLHALEHTVRLSLAWGIHTIMMFTKSFYLAGFVLCGGGGDDVGFLFCCLICIVFQQLWLLYLSALGFF